MTGPQWQSIVACLASFFPTMAERLTDDQAKVWRNALDSCEPEKVCSAIGRWYRDAPITDRGQQWPTPGVIARMASPPVKYAGTYKPISGPVCDIEENKRQARIGLEMLARRKQKLEPHPTPKG
jgi:hypothetical protein